MNIKTTEIITKTHTVELTDQEAKILLVLLSSAVCSPDWSKPIHNMYDEFKRSVDPDSKIAYIKYIDESIYLINNVPEIV